VAYEVLRRLAETKGDFAAAANMTDFESRKPEIARKVMEARRNGEIHYGCDECDMIL